MGILFFNLIIYFILYRASQTKKAANGAISQNFRVSEYWDFSQVEIK